MTARAFFLLGLALVLAGTRAAAHTFEPCLLAIDERGGGDYDVVWRPPGRSSGYNLSTFEVAPLFDARCQTIAVREDADELAATTVSRLHCEPPGLRGSTLRVPGIDATQLDVVVKVEWLDHTSDTTVLRSGDSTYTFRNEAGTSPAQLGTATKYAALGVQHILLGFDHLLFVLGLFFLVPSGQALLKTITAFTLGHSLTLALATFRIVALPNALTEALIALSIAFVARELLRPDVPALARARPWLIALAFGLLHGLGFAAALDDLGFQHDNVALALASFNAGVELGQIVFIAMLLAITRLLRPLARLQGANIILPYAIGSIAFVWVFERVARFWQP